MRWLGLVPTSLLSTAIYLASPTLASAASVTTLLSPFTGSEIQAELTLSDDGDNGAILGSLKVVGGVGDLRGLFLDIEDNQLLSGLSVTGSDVSGVMIGNVINLGQGSNLNGHESPCPCDLGVAFGSPGMGKDDVQSTEFLITHREYDLTLSLFSDQLAGVRITSVGQDSYSKREGSAKLVGVVPEPSTALLVALGLAGLAARRQTRTGGC